ncbi:hypothetical protein ACQ1PV_09240 [Ornithobacterium rhinotracheale]|uniref:hypothetical protein n=1 Tax=Ornithobacterium rhinotracheale TaxID=28251 RepID=UPI00129C7474|nr:hypothetical protein [Ornithobacterium rhinotracheale]MRJ09772.1 hypothetical protein [Ornithobacterium rhinotracheale]
MKKIIEYIIAVGLIAYYVLPVAFFLLLCVLSLFDKTDLKIIFILFVVFSTLFVVTFIIQEHMKSETDKILEKNKQERARRRAEQAEEEAKPLPQWDANENITYHFKKEECGTYAKIRKNRLKKLRPFG